VFSAGELVDATAVSKGKGFAGVMKRHNFKGLGAGHGVHKVHRAPGAIGACATPSRVFKGTKMAGRMGHQRVTTLNLEVVQADPEREVVLIKGALPGPRAGEARIAVVDAWDFSAPKTREAKEALEALGLTGNVLVVLDRDDLSAFKSFRNMPDAHPILDAELNAYDILCSDWVVFTRATLPATSQPAATPEPEPPAASQPAPPEEQAAE